jgi:hypothetical protein
MSSLLARGNTSTPLNLQNSSYDSVFFPNTDVFGVVSSMITSSSLILSGVKKFLKRLCEEAGGESYPILLKFLFFNYGLHQ